MTPRGSPDRNTGLSDLWLLEDHGYLITPDNRITVADWQITFEHLTGDPSGGSGINYDRQCSAHRLANDSIVAPAANRSGHPAFTSPRSV
jgi:hypothetical protein